MKWQEILIHGDPKGLKSFAKLLIKIAETEQDQLPDPLIEAREHMHLQPKYDLSNSSGEVIIGRLDAKGTGDFYNRYFLRQIEIKSENKRIKINFF
jgi:hypothetical protein